MIKVPFRTIMHELSTLDFSKGQPLFVPAKNDSIKEKISCFLYLLLNYFWLIEAIELARGPRSTCQSQLEQSTIPIVKLQAKSLD